MRQARLLALSQNAGLIVLNAKLGIKLFAINSRLSLFLSDSTIKECMVTIEEVKGSALSPRNGIIVHGCNAQGVMNSGFAKSVREMYPGAFRVYRQAFEKGGLRLGEVHYYRHPGELDGSRVIIANAITQQYYGRDKKVVYVNYDAISTCFDDIAKWARQTDLPVHFPLVGCGLANGEWANVAARIEQALGPDIKKTLWIYP